jgi:putative tryptophan/tyrosine transport system substrate-binding protein
VLWREPAAWPNAQQAAQVLGVDVLSVEVSGLDVLQGALDKSADWGPDALVFEPQPVLVSQFAAFAATHRLPAISGNGGFPGAGGLMSYAPRVQDNFRRAAAYVDKVLRGAKAADLPVEQPMVFAFVINLRTAQALGLSLPQHVLLQATEVLQ